MPPPHIFRQNPPGTISGRQLGEAAHRLVVNSLQVNRGDRNRPGLLDSASSYGVNAATAMYPNGRQQRGPPRPGGFGGGGGGGQWQAADSSGHHQYERSAHAHHHSMPPHHSSGGQYGRGSYQWQPVGRGGGVQGYPQHGGYPHNSSSRPTLSQPPPVPAAVPYAAPPGAGGAYNPYAGYQAYVSQQPQQQQQPPHDNWQGMQRGQGPPANRFSSLKRGGDDRRHQRPPGFDRR